MATAFASTATATGTAVLLGPTHLSAARSPPFLAHRRFPASTSPPLRFSSVFRRSSSLCVRASSEESSSQIDEFINDFKEKWDSLDNKSSLALYGGGAIVAVWLSSIIIGTINSLPVLPKLMELVGLGYTGWFVYRYLLFKQSRKELAADFEELKKKITGTDE